MAVPQVSQGNVIENLAHEPPLKVPSPPGLNISVYFSTQINVCFTFHLFSFSLGKHTFTVWVRSTLQPSLKIIID